MPELMQGNIALNMICQGERYRPVDGTKAREIARSMEFQGLLQPIGVRPCVCENHDVLRHFRLLFGAHRLEAADTIGWDSIAATIFPDDMTEDMARLAELQENSARNDLTKSQRDKYAAEIGRLLAKIAEDRHVAIGENMWWDELAKTTGIPDRTLRNRWAAFCIENGLEVSPSHGLKYAQDFFDWLEAQHHKAEAEKERKAKEEARRRQQKACANEVEVLTELIQEYGFALVYEEIWEVVCTQRGITIQPLEEVLQKPT
jgi:ParB-like nuclease family protein